MMSARVMDDIVVSVWFCGGVGIVLFPVSLAGADQREAATRKERPMKVRNSLRSLKNKPGAQVVRRRGKVYVINKKEPRFKARQG